MSKSDTPFEAIDTGQSGGTLRSPSWRKATPIVAFDFETTGEGDPFLLSVSPAGEDSYCITPKDGNETLTTGQIISELAKQKWTQYMGMWFNIGFDAEVFISGLGTERAQELRIENETTIQEGDFEGITIKYIKGKLLEFKDGNRHVVTHYDIGNIVRGSLDKCAKEWLGEEKVETVDASKFSDREYRREHKDEIEYYAHIDAQLTRRLAEAVTEKAESLDIPMGRPVSTGYMAAEFARERLDETVGTGPAWVQSMAWESYAGGRFEVYERGDVGEVAGPDINSAYPAILAKLPDPGSLVWENHSNPSLSDVRNADYGFVTVECTTVRDRRIMPFAEKIDGKVCYPAMEQHETTVLLPIFMHAIENGYVEHFELKHAALGYEVEETVYPFDFLNELYDERKELEANGRKFAGLMLKIAMNSLYGKTAQTTLKQEIIEEPTDINEIQASDGMRLLGIDDLPVRERQVAGSMFNPFLATYITGLTRLELHRAVLEAGLENETVLLATDCIMVHADAYERSNFDRLLGDSLGEWDYDYRGDAFVVGSGVYEVRNDGELLKTATRGFREADLGNDGLEGAAREAGADPIRIANERPITLGEALARGSNRSVAEIGKFLSKDETERALNANFDTKRRWEREATFNDLLDSSEYGRPLVVSN